MVGLIATASLSYSSPPLPLTPYPAIIRKFKLRYYVDVT